MKQYSFTKVDLLLNGLAVDGFAESAGIITAQRSRNAHDKVMDAKGDMNIATSGDLSGSISFNLLQTSTWNDTLRAWSTAAQTLATNGSNDVFVPIYAGIKDLMGGDQVIATTGFIPKMQPVVRGSGIAVVPWVLEFEVIHFVPTGGYKDTFAQD